MDDCETENDLSVSRDFCGKLLVAAPSAHERPEVRCSELVRRRLTKLTEEANELCWTMEKLPASEQQTKCSLMASRLRQKLAEMAQPTNDGFTYEGKKN